MVDVQPVTGSTAGIDYKWVSIGDTFRPSELQRPMDDAHVDRIVANWNDAAFGTPMLSYREHGNRGPRGEAFAIVSGQHRLAAAQKIGKTRVYCAVVYGLDGAGEARLFIDEDKRKRQSALGKFHLARLAGDAEAVAIWDMTTKAGFLIARFDGDKTHRTLRCVNALAKAYRRGNLHRVLAVLAGAFGYDQTGAGQEIVNGISVALKYRPTIDLNRLASRMETVGTLAIMQRYRAGLASTSGAIAYVAMANALIGIYNYKLREDRMVDNITVSETRNIFRPDDAEVGRARALEVKAITRTGKTLAEARAEVAAKRATATA